MATAPVIGVLALQGDVREHVAALESVGARPVEVKRPEELTGLDGLVLPGGESTTLSRLMRVFGMREPLRAQVDAGLPVYGSCAGMILLADEVVDTRADYEGIGGLDVVVRRNAFGRQIDSFEADLAVEAIAGDPFHAVFIRAPWVEKAGAEVDVLATVGSGPGVGRIVAVRQGPLLATSFHPELTGDVRVHQYFVEIVRGQA